MAGTSLIFAQIHACQIICSGPSAERPFYCKYYSKRKKKAFCWAKVTAPSDSRNKHQETPYKFS